VSRLKDAAIIGWLGFDWIIHLLLVTHGCCNVENVVSSCIRIRGTTQFALWFSGTCTLIMTDSPWWYVYLTSHWTTSRWTSHPRPWWTYSTSYIGQWIILVFVLTAFVPCRGNNNTSIDDYGAMYSLGLETGASIQMLVLPCCGSCFALTMGVSSFRTELAWRRLLKATFWRRNGTPTRCKDIVLLKLAAPANYNHIPKLPSDATIQLL
jgi:hypothetical protein